MNERILVPLDDSDPARTALEEALETFGSKEIVVIHVIDTDDFSHGAEGAAAGGLFETRKEEAEELFEEAELMADEYDVSLETALETGQAADQIVTYAETNDIDHIVMGSHGRSGISRILVGSVAESIIREAPVSVTISRPRPTADE